jgi:hypothetical protein
MIGTTARNMVLAKKIAGARVLSRTRPPRESFPISSARDSHPKWRTRRSWGTVQKIAAPVAPVPSPGARARNDPSYAYSHPKWRTNRPYGTAERASKVAAAVLTAIIAIVSGIGCAPETGSSQRERSTVSVIRDERPGLVRIDGIGPIRGFAKGRDNTFMHCLELVLAATGRGVGYDELMGLSGLAFRVQFRMDQWDVGNPDPLVGADCLKALFPAIGWEYETWIVRQDEIAEANSLRQAINQSIDRGIPVLAANIIPPEDWGIILGYRPDRVWLCRSYNGGAERVDQPAKGWPTAVVILTRRLQGGRSLRQAKRRLARPGRQGVRRLVPKPPRRPRREIRTRQLLDLHRADRRPGCGGAIPAIDCQGLRSAGDPSEDGGGLV